ncbi:MAG: ABC transporter permease subunit, partial [Candidatus Competibacter sp.]|nr:ABC transporter permease subunit [Candidatus Competibacter sp.]
EASGTEIARVFLLGSYTLARVVILTALASLIWVPIGIWIGLRPRLAQHVQPLVLFLSAFPANLLFPVVVSFIVVHRLNPEIWLSPLMILGTQWYILFNVIAGAAALPSDLKEATANLGLRGLLLWRRVLLPAVFSSFLTGGLTASGGAWNASVVAEVASWGTTTLTASGIGAYIAQQTVQGDHPRVALGIAVMSLYVVLFNRLFWKRLYTFAQRRLALD